MKISRRSGRLPSWTSGTATESGGGRSSPYLTPSIAPARVVRVAAAEGLLQHGVTTIDGPARQVLAQAQDELAESLRTFNDVAADHTTLGSLESARGRDDAASAELTTAVNLDPADP